MPVQFDLSQLHPNLRRGSQQFVLIILGYSGHSCGKVLIVTSDSAGPPSTGMIVFNLQVAE